MASWLIPYFIAILLVQFQASIVVECKTKDASLGSYLTRFNSTRNNHVSPAAKTAARNYIMQTFRDHGLDTWTEQLASNQNNFPGINVIGRVSGRYTGTSQDKVVIIASHYDTVKTTNGVDDNGSGMTALLQAVKQYMSPDYVQCTQNHTLLFVAFDLEENQACANVGLCSCKLGVRCGSENFVKNFSRYLNKTGGTLQGAYVMDTIMNYDSDIKSQALPPNTEKVLPGPYKSVSDNQFRGDFLTVIGREKKEAYLRQIFINNYKKTSKFRIVEVALPFEVRPSALDPAIIKTGIKDFLRSDHAEFWNHQKSWPAVFLTDTADFRGYMRTCYHQMCDDMSRVTPEMITTMGRTADALVGVVHLMTHRACEKKERCSSVVRSNAEETIKSPGYPSKYPNGADCTWEIKSKPAWIISINEWELEESKDCTNDYVEIRHGNELAGRYCGKTRPSGDIFKRKDTVFTIRFHSDAFDAYKGFVITSVYNGAKTTASLTSAFVLITAAFLSTTIAMVTTY